VSLFGKNREDSSRNRTSGGASSEAPSAPLPTPEASRQGSSPASARPASRAGSGEKMANIGKSITIKGDLSGNEDLVVEGNVEGKIELPNNQLTIGANGNVAADVSAKTIVVVGKVSGNVSGTERVEIESTGSVDGDVRAPRLVVQEGAVLNGSVEMGQPKAAAEKPKLQAAEAQRAASPAA
jgi:cytoskeletal protein CcmA (bactofilin family)